MPRWDLSDGSRKVIYVLFHTSIREHIHPIVNVNSLHTHTQFAIHAINRICANIQWNINHILCGRQARRLQRLSF